MQSRRCDPGFSDSQPVPIPGNAPSSSHVSVNVVGKHWRVLNPSGSLYERPETDQPMFYGCIRIICAWGLHKWFGSWKYLLHNPDWSEFWSPEPKKKTIYSSTGISHSHFCWKWEAETGESRTLWASRLAVQLWREPVSNKVEREEPHLRLASHLHTETCLHSHTWTCRHIYKHQMKWNKIEEFL